MRYAARIEYDGSRFCGWQRQVGVATVQESLELALGKVANEKIVVHTAGRTDTGVHATSQFVHFDTDCQRDLYNWSRGVNTQLPVGVAMTWISPVKAAFHARFSAEKRHYRYIILNRTMKPSYLAGKVSWFYRPLELAAMQRAAEPLLGTHDFSAYRAASCQSQQPVKTLFKLDIQQQEKWIWMDVVADGFLHHMVRNLAGVLTTIGSGEADVSWARQVLDLKDRTKGGITATPDGLYLTHVDYAPQFGLPAAVDLPRFW